jgi:hypothetical protein
MKLGALVVREVGFGVTRARREIDDFAIQSLASVEVLLERHRCPTMPLFEPTVPLYLTSAEESPSFALTTL